MKKNKLKKGFTLVELMIFFVFISLVLAASTPIITKRIRYIPDRVPHGKFVCYGGSYALYNNTRLIASGAGCNFKPPKKAALFKIELVGAGAGGYQLHEDIEEDWEYVDTPVELSEVSTICSLGSNGVTCPPNAILREVLKGASFTISTMSPSAFAGEDVTETYVGVSNPTITKGVKCWKPTPYECTKTRKVQKDTGEKDEEGNTIYETVEEEYTTTCYTTQAEDDALDLYTCSEINSAISAIAASISSQRTCGSNDWCYTLANENFIAPYKQQVAWFDGMISGFGNPGLVARGYGAAGGFGTGMHLNGKIDFCDHYGFQKNACPNGNTKDEQYVKDEEVRNYLSRLFTEYYITGTTKVSGSCMGWGDKTYKEFPDTKVDNGSYKHGEDGKEPRFYGAIKAWGDTCVTNIDFPTGGEGGWIRINESSSAINGSTASGSVRQGKNATDTLTGKVNGPYKVESGYIAQSIPSLYYHTELTYRRHTVGQGGGAADTPVVRYVTQLDDDCIFSVASGGPAISEGISAQMIKQLEENLSTHLTCNDGTLRISAEGGFYNPSSYSKVYHGFDLINSDGTSKNRASLTTSDPGGISPYIPDDVFSKFELENKWFGAGGHGDIITDTCTTPKGFYEVSRKYGNTTDITVRRNLDRTIEQQQRCDAKGSHSPGENVLSTESIKRSNASAGSSGVIIISW